MPRNMGRNTGLSAHAGLQRARESAIRSAARRAAAELAAQGQGSDRRLIHVDSSTLAAIRSAYGPGAGPGWRNPVTGLEQFSPETGMQDAEIPDASWGAPGVGSSSAAMADPPSSSDDALAAAYDVLSGIGASSNGRPQVAQIPPLLFLEEPPVLVRPNLPYPKSPAEPPGRGWEWTGRPGENPGDPETLLGRFPALLRPSVPYPKTHTEPPGPKWIWRGASDRPGDPMGNWHNPETGESLHPDLDHEPPTEPHWDWHSPQGPKYRWYPDDRLELAK